MNKQERELRSELGDDLYERMCEHLYSKKPLHGKGSPFSEMLQRVVNTMLEGEVEAHLTGDSEAGLKNKRNGKITKTIKSSAGPLTISTPRDRNSTFEPKVVEKRQRELTSGIDDQILALYAQGNSVEDVRRLVEQLYGIEMSSGHISSITDKVLVEIDSWRRRDLQTSYVVIYLDAIHFKVRQEGKYEAGAFYTVYSVDWEGQRDLLGLYIHKSEGASMWRQILEDLRSRGVEDVLVMCTDDLQGFREAIEDVFPKTVVQKCIVHHLRNCFKSVDSKDYREVVKDLRKIYQSPNREEAQIALETFETKWEGKYTSITDKWVEKWDELLAYMDFPLGLQKMIYTTNPVEALHRIMRKLIKSKAAWVSEKALLKQLYLSLMYNQKSWRRRARGWKSVMRDLQNKYPERLPSET